MFLSAGKLTGGFPHHPLSFYKWQESIRANSKGSPPAGGKAAFALNTL
jgi:hypothetical protein